MQINGTQLASLFISKPIGTETNARTPVVIDGNSFKIEADDNSNRTNIRPVRQEDISANNAQQARFIRSFSINDEPSSATSPSSIQTQSLPKGVQQYLQVSKISNERAQQLLDETV
jgi:hypothetical protein